MWEDIVKQIIAVLGMVISGNTIFYWIVSFGIKKRLNELGVIDAGIVKKAEITVNKIDDAIKIISAQNDRIAGLEATVNHLLDKVEQFIKQNDERDEKIGAILDDA